MKALTAFRRRLLRRGTITKTEIRPLLESDNVISFQVRYTFEPNSKRDDARYHAFRAAWNDALKLPEET